ncbi:MAG: amidohydrolase family protein [Thermodesulfobacteriota bacterium]
MSTSAPRFYSCDDHLDMWNLPADLWADRLPGKLRDRAPTVVEKGNASFWTCDGKVMAPFRILSGYSAIRRAGIDDDGSRASNAKLRLEDMDRDGLRASVIYGPHLFGMPIDDPDLRAAVLAAYNDWASEFNAQAPDRLCVLPVLPTDSPERATAELERVARNGHRGAIISPFELRCSDPAWDRLWAAAQETSLPISFHIGHGTSQVKIVPQSWEMAAFAAVGPIQLDEPLAMMIYSGALERHPGMKLVLAESGVGWLPYFVRRMDQTAAKHVPNAQDYRLRAKPSEIFRRQVYATFEEEPLGPSLLPLLGPDNFMWASDYPHPDSTFPHSRDAVAEAFADLEPAFVEQVTVTNCARLYRFAS